MLQLNDNGTWKPVKDQLDRLTVSYDREHLERLWRHYEKQGNFEYRIKSFREADERSES
jgi:hypothetical protein